MRYGSDVGIAKQREDRVVEGRRGNLDLPAFGQPAICRQNQLQNFALLPSGQGLILQAEVATLGDQRADFAIVRKELLVEPGHLGQNLQIAKSLAAERAAGPLDI